MKILLSILFSVIISSTFSQDLNCNQFRKGHFSISDSDVGNSFITRKKNIQIEYGEKTQLKMKLQIEWISDCTYTLRIKRILSNPNNIQLNPEMVLTVDIIEIRDNSFIQKSTSNLFDIVVVQEIFVNKKGSGPRSR